MIDFIFDAHKFLLQLTPATPVAKAERLCAKICAANTQRRVAFDIRVLVLVMPPEFIY